MAKFLKLINVRKIYAAVKYNFYIQPGARKTEISGRHDGEIKIKIKALPVDGAANEELIRFLAEWLDISKSSLEIVSGLKSRHKTVSIKLADEPNMCGSAAARNATSSKMAASHSNLQNTKKTTATQSIPTDKKAEILKKLQSI